VRYIHLNPVEAGIVRRRQGYKWSSHSFYMQPYLAPGWLKVGEVLERFASIREFNQFVLSGNEDTVNEFYNSSRLNPILGGESFIKLHKGSLSKVSQEYPRYERLAIRLTVEGVVSRVAEAYDTDTGGGLRGRRGRDNEARRVGMYLVKCLCDLTLREVAERFGVDSYGVVGWACNKVRMKMESDNRFRKRLTGIQDIISQQKT